MKKLTKVLLIISSVLMLSSIIIGLIAFIGLKKDSDNCPEYVTKKYAYKSGTAISSINIDMSYGEVEFVKSDSTYILITDVLDENLEFSSDNGDISIIISGDNDIDVFGWNLGFDLNPSNNHMAKIKIGIDQEFLPQLCDINLGVGCVSLNDIKSERMIVQVGVGSIQGGNLDSNSGCALQTGIGNININSVISEKLILKNGIGITDIDSNNSSTGIIDVTAKCNFGFMRIGGDYGFGIVNINEIS